jgi:hypothetical protein
MVAQLPNLIECILESLGTLPVDYDGRDTNPGPSMFFEVGHLELGNYPSRHQWLPSLAQEVPVEIILRIRVVMGPMH